jgi:predicted branched-subunit amino acid permease
VKSSVSIVLFFLLSGFFLSVLLGAIEHSRKLLLLAAGCLAAVVCIIVFLAPVQLPSIHLSKNRGTTTTTTTTTTVTYNAPSTSELSGAQAE